MVDGVSKRYGRRPALSKIEVTLIRGRPCVVMGENGAGKSTLINMLGTALSPDEGTIRYETADGMSLRGIALRSRLGYVSHKPMVYPELSALENVVFFARIAGVRGATEAARRFISRLGLDPDSPQPASQFSRGMQARLAAARALVTEPELLLLDEAASGLDRDGRRTLLALVKEVAPERIVAVATHELNTAAELAQQFLQLRRGRVVHDEDLSALEPDARRDRIRDLLDGTAAKMVPVPSDDV